MNEEIDKIKLDLSVVSFLLNHIGHDGLLTYLAFETKKKLKDEYCPIRDFAFYTFVKNEKRLK